MINTTARVRHTGATMSITGGFGTTIDLERGTSLPTCTVGGMVMPGAMCGAVIVGGNLCGHPGECQHKGPNAIYTSLDKQELK